MIYKPVGGVMRNSYQINFKKCNFYVGDYGVFHSASDLFGFLSISPEASGVIVDQWRSKITKCPVGWGWGLEDYLVPEECLLGFLKDIIAASPEETIVSAESLLGKIIQERLDAIVGNDTPHITHENLAVRRSMQEFSKQGYFGFYSCMDNYQGLNLLNPEQAAEWRRIKKILPDKSGAINDRHLVALVMLIAPIYPDLKSVKLPEPLRYCFTLQDTFLEVCKMDSLSRTQKALLIQEALRRSGLQIVKETHQDEQPEP